MSAMLGKLQAIRADGLPIESAIGEERPIAFTEPLSPIVPVNVRRVLARFTQACTPVVVEQRQLQIDGEVWSINPPQQPQRERRILGQAAGVTFEAELDVLLRGVVAEITQVVERGLPLRFGRFACTNHAFTPRRTGKHTQPPRVQPAPQGLGNELLATTSAVLLLRLSLARRRVNQPLLEVADHP